jgi:cobalt-zinc-cadmium efflux system outer membrane protein
MWGAQQAGFEIAQGDLKSVMKDVPALEVLQSHLENNPELARWEAEWRLRQAALSAEMAARIPDLQGSVGYLQYEEDGTDALAFGVGLPLPLFDRNQGNIAAARHGLSKAEAERSATGIALSADLAEAHALLSGALQRVTALREKVVPAMEEAFRAAHEGYQQGKFGYLDMLDAQRTLFEAKVALLEAQGGYQSALIDIQRLTGTDIESLMNETEE